MKIGEVVSRNAEIELNHGRPTVELAVSNAGDRPIQVGSHFHFFEANKRLEFDREAAFGFRLDIPSGTSVRFEPGETKTVRLCAFGGARRVHGLNGLTEGQAVPAGAGAAAATARARVAGFLRKDPEGRK
jgi:urease beta subunit